MSSNLEIGLLSKQFYRLCSYTWVIFNTFNVFENIFLPVLFLFLSFQVIAVESSVLYQKLLKKVSWRYLKINLGCVSRLD